VRAIQIAGANTIWDVDIFCHGTSVLIENEKRCREQILDCRLAIQRYLQSSLVWKVVAGKL
jgi:hypothetical protein